MSVFNSVNSQNNDDFDDFANAVRRAKEIAAKINGADTTGTKRPLDDVAARIPEAKKLAVSDDKGIVQQLATMQAQRSAGGIADAITVEEWKVPDKMVGLKMAPEIAKPAPDFAGIAVINGAFKNIKLSDYKGKYLVLFFYPLDFTFVCPTEIIAFSERVEEFKKIGCEVIGCSTDSHFSHLAWINTPRKEGGLGKMNIPLLADKSCKISKDYGVYKEDEGLTFRGLFIIDDNGTLRQITINDLPVGRSVDETLRLVQAFQYTDKYGEVCPAGWKPGDDTMKPDPDGSKEYFKKH